MPRFFAGSVDSTVWVSDKADLSLWIQKDVISVKGISATGDESVLVQGADYLLDPETALPGTEDSDFVISFSNYEKISDYSKIVIEYSAEVTAGAADKVSAASGLGSTAKLHYYTDENSAVTVSSGVTVFTYGIKISKTDEEGGALDGAVFELYHDNGNELDESNVIGFILTADGVYRPVYSSDRLSEFTFTVTDLETDSEGKLTINGLDAGSYFLVESSAPGGYIKLTEPVKIEIKDEFGEALTQAPNGKPENGNGDEYSDGYVPVTVKNSRGMTLPVTGGNGILIFAAIGVVLVGCGVTVFVMAIRKKRSSR